jgi:hypothetical protein
MKKNAVEILIPYLVDKGFVDFVILEPQDIFNKAIVGFDEKQNRLIYDYDKMVDAWARTNEESSLESTYENALEWINYNTLRAVPYMGKYRPIITTWDDDTETDKELDL